MAKSPKTTKVTKKDSDMKIKSILKEPKKVKAESPPPQLVPQPKTTTSLSSKNDGRQMKTTTTTTTTTSEDDDEYYHDLFFDIVSKNLPLVKLGTGDDYYPCEHLQDDIVCVIDEIYERGNFLVIPDPEVIQKIAQLKIPNDKKLQNEFIFGTDKNIESGIYSKIKKYTDPIRKNVWAQIEQKYSPTK